MRKNSEKCSPCFKYFVFAYLMWPKHNSYVKYRICSRKCGGSIIFLQKSKRPNIISQRISQAKATKTKIMSVKEIENANATRFSVYAIHTTNT